MEIVDNLNRRYIRGEVREKNENGMEGYRSRMLQRNKIPGLLGMDKRCIDGKEYFYYDITGKQSMHDRERTLKINGKIMDAFILDLEQVLQGLEDYLLKQSEICLCPEYIWQESEIGKWNFLYIPDGAKKQSEDIERLLEYIMDRIDSEDEYELERFYTFYSEALQNLEGMNAMTLVRLWKKGEKITESHEKTEKVDIDYMEEPSLTGPECSPVEYERRLGYKEKIYTVPYHGRKIGGRDEVSLT